MVHDKFYKESLTLTLSNLTTGILGFIFSIILSQKLGPEGMGLYNLIMPIYNLIICLICGGMVTAISKISATYFAKKDYNNLDRSIDISIFFDLIWSTLIVVTFFLSTSFITERIIKDCRASYAVKIICPAMIFIAISNIYKGYFYGTTKTKIPSTIDIVEKSTRIVFFIFITKLFNSQDIKTNVTLGYITLTAGEFMSLVLLHINYKISKVKHKNSFTKNEGRAQLLFDILIISIPLCLNGFLSTILSTVSTFIVPRRLMSIGMSYNQALATIGKFNGMALTIIFFPLIIIGSVSTILIPELSQNMTKKDYWTMEKRINEVITLSLLLGIAAFVTFFTLPNFLGKLLFKRNDLGSYIRFVSFAAPIVYVDSTSYGILNGLGKQNILLRNSLIASLMEVVLLFILTGIPSINIYGYGLTLIITSAFTLILNLYEIKKFCNINLPFYDLFIFVLCAILIHFILKIINNIVISPGLKVILIILISFSLFLSLSYILKKKKGNWR